ncbi:HAMP domain-containing histidine kinase [Mucilaginibacter daejeonensis]|uniref:sensor histidine kinase n=1 Tax=Mucilaginibacter daejeonensis TaxID=398049 RepID=UPI001D176A34|nr:HAMP domain-containing sensor histidine kinase [Mucilaginibacter daejeonensis]UEG53351.1 HAMP domain-containing histidine kinase [Mucilaginibacter daejeonensis]
MKVRTRLALQFTLLFAVLFFLALSSLYVIIKENRKRSFYDMLDDRALTVAKFHLGEDDLSAQTFSEVLHQFPRTLSNEAYRVYDDHLNTRFALKDDTHWPRSFLLRINKEKMVHAAQGQKLVTGMRYLDNSGSFIIIVSAVDKRGMHATQQMGLVMSVVFVVFLGITFFVGQFFATTSLKPIGGITNDLGSIKASELHKRLKVSTGRVDEIDGLSLSINQLLEHLEQSFESQRSFVAHASHELRTPLTSMLGQAETTLLKDRSTEEYKTALREVVENVIQLNDVITHLRELMDINMDLTNFEPIRIDELAWQIAEEFKPYEERLVIDLQLPDDPDLSMIHGNRRLLFIAINNILSNALKFSDKSQVNFDIIANGRTVILQVEDKGIGIHPAELSKIFQPFYRSFNALGYPGNGIGLSLSQKIFKLHNAAFEVHSLLGKGTVFTITFTTA